MTRAQATLRLGELHVEHACLDCEIARIEVRKREIETEIDSLTSALIVPERRTNEAFPATRIPGTGNGMQSAKPADDA
jgi:hypothetical protein